MTTTFSGIGYQSDKLADEYDSAPGYFDPMAEPSAPAGGDAEACGAFGAATSLRSSVLRKSAFEEDGYTHSRNRATH